LKIPSPVAVDVSPHKLFSKVTCGNGADSRRLLLFQQGCQRLFKRPRAQPVAARIPAAGL
jgi:hypothetical protein